LWPSLIEEWRLSPEEVAYIDRQQGTICQDCGASLRAMVLALAIMNCCGYSGLFKDFARRPFRRVNILEINEAANLTKFLRRIRGHILARYPDVDMMALPYADATFDLVIHSDTLEHVPDPIRALGECERVLRPGGYCVYTVPTIIGRLTESRQGKPPSYHGVETEKRTDYTVFTEYGADAWTHPIKAGFAEARILSIDYPAAHAITAIKRSKKGP
jgi:SAM-dependent methyltransferase